MWNVSKHWPLWHSSSAASSTRACHTRDRSLVGDDLVDDRLRLRRWNAPRCVRRRDPARRNWMRCPDRFDCSASASPRTNLRRRTPVGSARRRTTVRGLEPASDWSPATVVADRAIHRRRAAGNAATASHRVDRDTWHSCAPRADRRDRRRNSRRCRVSTPPRCRCRRRASARTAMRCQAQRCGTQIGRAAGVGLVRHDQHVGCGAAVAQVGDVAQQELCRPPWRYERRRRVVRSHSRRAGARPPLRSRDRSRRRRVPSAAAGSRLG